MNNTEHSTAEGEVALPPPDEFLDLEPCFRPVAQQYGREMFALVYNAGMAGQAVSLLATQAQKHHSKSMAHAAGVLAAAFNHTSSALAQAKGWSPELLAQCDRDIGMAFRSKIVTPGSAILLDS